MVEEEGGLLRAIFSAGFSPFLLPSSFVLPFISQKVSDHAVCGPKAPTGGLRLPLKNFPFPLFSSSPPNILSSVGWGSKQSTPYCAKGKSGFLRPLLPPTPLSSFLLRSSLPHSSLYCPPDWKECVESRKREKVLKTWLEISSHSLDPTSIPNPVHSRNECKE